MVFQEHSNSWCNSGTVSKESTIGLLNKVFETQEYISLEQMQLEVPPSFVRDVVWNLSTCRHETDVEQLLPVWFDTAKRYMEKCSALST